MLAYIIDPVSIFTETCVSLYDFTLLSIVFLFQPAELLLAFLGGQVQ